ncbi:MAG TPA: DUF1684 domain-containing protein [Mycobacteriales bacterium]|jgi:hypothetical protein|nr:DUF1684 domain-containing protein [Mycobacteriales bacterium]
MTVAETDRTTFVAEWHEWHRQHEAHLADPHGFLAITALHWLNEDDQRFDGLPGSWRTDANGVQVRLAEGAELVVDGEAVHGEFNFGVIPERGGRTAAFGDAVVEVAKRGGYDILRPRHPDNALLTNFAGTPTFPPSPEWVVAGRFTPFSAPRDITVGAAVEGLQHVYNSPGQIEFDLSGQTFRLTAFNGKEPGSLMVLFTDATSGVTTYAANRALQVGTPDADGAVVLDFNRAANLPCAYTDLATCPLPPAENQLSIGVEAGEKIPYERRP